MPKLVLASASPRRRMLLADAGFSFEVVPANVDETQLSNESPAAYAERLALHKAKTVARDVPGAWVLGADTIVVVGSDEAEREVLGKPNSPAEAIGMLTRLSNAAHFVTTAVSIVISGPDDLETHTFSRTSKVYFRKLSGEEIRDYVATGEPMDKAGAYAIQEGAASFVDRYEGSWSTIVGLPIEEVSQWLRKHAGF